jgi:toxin secretion/phage lysis holin
MQELLKLNFANQIWQIVIPLALMVCDIITGYYNAWKKKKVKSAKMRDGIGKKIAELVYILIGLLFSYAFNVQAISYFVCIYIIYMELTSVAENCKKLGISMPKFISEKLNEEDKKK